MILGVCKNFLTPGGAQAGAQGAGLGAQREQITVLHFAPFWYHILKAGRGLQ